MSGFVWRCPKFRCFIIMFHIHRHLFGKHPIIVSIIYIYIYIYVFIPILFPLYSSLSLYIHIQMLGLISFVCWDIDCWWYIYIYTYTWKSHSIPNVPMILDLHEYPMIFPSMMGRWISHDIRLYPIYGNIRLPILQLFQCMCPSRIEYFLKSHNIMIPQKMGYSWSIPI